MAMVSLRSVVNRGEPWVWLWLNSVGVANWFQATFFRFWATFGDCFNIFGARNLPWARFRRLVTRRIWAGHGCNTQWRPRVAVFGKLWPTSRVAKSPDRAQKGMLLRVLRPTNIDRQIDRYTVLVDRVTLTFFAQSYFRHHLWYWSVQS